MDSRTRLLAQRPTSISQFAGKERDAETGLDFFGARYLSAAQGRFTSKDPVAWLNWQHGNRSEQKRFADFLSNPQNFNGYAYVLNNPLSSVDPDGLLGCKVDGKDVPCHIVVVYDKKKAKGTLYLLATIEKKEQTLLEGKVVVGADGNTPVGLFHASYWEKDHVSKKYGGAADTPWSKSPLGLNAFGPFQLHLKETENRGIWIHGTMGPGWVGSSEFNRLLSPTSHGCVRCSNPTIMRLHDLMPNPSGNEVRITTDPSHAPEEDD